MNTNQLSHRLERVASYAAGFHIVADIGSDHAYLPCYLCLKDDSLKAIAGEINEGPYQSALKQVRLSQLEDQIDVRKGSGLNVLHQGEEIDVLTIAGMGGPLIASILDEGKDKLMGVKRLVLQPNVASHAVRQWIMDHHYRIVAEDILEEDEKIYEVIVAEPSEAKVAYTETELWLGPILMQHQTSVFKKKWEHEKTSWKRVLKQVQLGNKSVELEEKQADLNQKIKMVEEAL
ncbi:tRNA (adenine(22)-N(1))-methyltransferase [Shouchella lehensis]|uniref:tRNA (Adenine-N(1))-methyltransferase n=1 Tax=Shouchella lehensis TaxID=300825 RepID=A0A4Y7WIC9_9BACI|nr:tRNA (adenine(22)-N(1))-methyltransferase TrmK [Shouchella lehensis]MBG9785710.1 SAM-dependent methyltransferase [Shouchella lehensis]TES48173.1 tRNA (adenine-N(1))-methyltransferase [Shouchella lehensis]